MRGLQTIAIVVAFGAALVALAVALVTLLFASLAAHAPDPFVPSGDPCCGRPGSWGEVAASATTATVAVTNTGERSGTEVVQAYVDRPDGRIFAGFSKVTLEPGESTVATVDLSPAAFRRWDVGDGGWVVDPGPHPVVVGRSCADVVAADEVVVAD